MRFKRRNCEKVAFHFPDDLHCFENNYDSKKYLWNICHVTDGVEQINLLKEIELILLQHDLSTDELMFVIDALCILFYQAPNKSSQKKTLHRIINEVSKKFPSIVEMSLEKYVRSLIDISVLQNCQDIYFENTVQYILSLLNDLKLGKKIINQNSDSVWNYISFIFNTVIEHLKKENSLPNMNDLFIVCQSILKLMTHFIQTCDKLKSLLKSNNTMNLQASSLNIKICLEYLLTNDDTSANCRLNAAFALCHLYYFSFGDKKLKKDLLNESYHQFPLSSQLCIYSGIMAILPLQDFINNEFAKEILHYNLNVIMKSDSAEALLISGRNILQWTNLIQNILCKNSVIDEDQKLSITHMFSEDEILMQQLFEYVQNVREHFIDTLRHLSKDIFRNILNIYLLASGYEPCKSPILKKMTNYLLKDLPPHKRGKYGMLSCIVEKIGTETILEWHPTLPNELYKALVESSLVSHVSEFCQVLYSSSKDSEDSFQNVWLVPLLEVLCKGSKEQTSAISEHILPRLLNVKPSSLSFFLSALSKMWENNIGNCFQAFISCMKVHHRQKGSLNYLAFLSNDCLIKAFYHADDKVRLAAFSLLCESFKTTEPIDQNSLDLIKAGLPFNMDCQSPSFRQELVSYMKKLFVRMVDSGYGLMKNQLNPLEGSDCSKQMLPTFYQEFLQWLREYLFNCLHPGANFPRRVTSLNLLCLLHEIMSDYMSIVFSEVAAHTLLNALSDTYDNNKLLALKILSSERSLKLNLEDGILFQTALTLASSTKPPDTATSAYMFAYMLHCPTLLHILPKYLQSISSVESYFHELEPNSSVPIKPFELYSIILILMNELYEQLQVAKTSLLEAAARAPLYGILTCIRSVLRHDINIKEMEIPCLFAWKHLFRKLIELSMNVAYVVEPIVSNSSPEGHLPVDTTEESIAQLQATVRRGLGSRFQSAVVQEDPSTESETVVLDIVKTHAVTAQILLLCCWRTHKEISLLLGDISEKLPIVNNFGDSQGLLCTSQVKEIGEYFIHQMSVVKHKGAFEQAYIGFSQLCHRLWRCNIPELVKLPEEWLLQIIFGLIGKGPDIQLCPTRRSAGLPFIIQGILTSEPSVANSSIFKQSMSALLTAAENDKKSHLQIHALNILRTLFRDACLGEVVMQFVAGGFKISIEGFKSDHWGVRNSSTLLYSALMTRVFGVNRSHDEAKKKNRLTGKVFFSYYKELYIYLHDELKNCANSLYDNTDSKISIQPSLYPILLLLGRLYQAPGEKDSKLSSFIPYLQKCACSPIWKTRHLASKALVSLIPQENAVSFLQLVIHFLPKCVTEIFRQNEVHGYLLQILYVLEEFSPFSDSQKDSVRDTLQLWLSSTLDLFIRYNNCLSTRATYLEIYLFAMSLDIKLDIRITCKLINTILDELTPIEYGNKLKELDKDNYLAITTAVLFLQSLQLNNEEWQMVYYPERKSLKSVVELIINLIENPFYEIVASIALEILLWLLQDNYEADMQCSDTSDDIVEFQRVFKYLRLLDKKKYELMNVLKDHRFYEQLLNLLEKKTNPSFKRQIYKVLSSMSICISSYSVHPFCDSWKLFGNFKDTLKCLEEEYSRDEVTRELLLFSTLLFVEVCQQYTSHYINSLNLHSDPDLTEDLIVKWLMKIEETAYPKNSILLRETIVSVLQLLHEKSVFPGSKLLGIKSSHLWQALLLLLVDDEPEIKQKASELVVKMKLIHKLGDNVSSVVPSKALAIMTEMYIENCDSDPSLNASQACSKLSDKHCNTAMDHEANSSLLQNSISVLINWMLCSYTVNSLDSMNDEQPFDKGEMNAFSEDLNITQIVSKYASLYLKCHTEEHFIIIQNILNSTNRVLNMKEVIELCLQDVFSILKKILNRTYLIPISDACFDQELILISQRLSVVEVLLPFISSTKSIYESIESYYKDTVPHHERNLYRLNNLQFRTFFTDNLMSKIERIISELKK